jgi:hypothetical protein
MYDLRFHICIYELCKCRKDHSKPWYLISYMTSSLPLHPIPIPCAAIHFVPHLRNRDTNNLNVLLRFLLIHLRILNLMHDIHARNRASKDGVFVVEPRLYFTRQ